MLATARDENADGMLQQRAAECLSHAWHDLGFLCRQIYPASHQWCSRRFFSSGLKVRHSEAELPQLVD